MLLIDVKGVFDHVARNCLLSMMKIIRANGDLICWIESLMSDRSVALVIYA